MSIRYEDLPAGRLRDAVKAAADRGEGRPVSSAARVHSTRARGRARNRYRCAKCDNVETAYKAAERHADSHGGARIDLELEAVR